MSFPVSPLSSPRERALFRRVADGVAGADEFQWLNDRLKTDAEMRRRFVFYMNMEAAMYEEVDALPVPPRLEGSISARSRRTFIRWKLVSMAVSGAAICLFFVWLLQGTEHPAAKNQPVSVPVTASDPVEQAPARATVVGTYSPTPFSPSEEAPPAVAIIVQADQSPEDQLFSTYQSGKQLGSGPILLPEGKMLIEFLNGAQLLLQGPAELKVQSLTSATLSAGIATVRVPESARGFVLNIPGGAIVDRGTEFSAEILSDRGCDLFVHEGEVEVSVLGIDGDTNSSMRVHQSEGARLNYIERKLERTAAESLKHLAITPPEVPTLETGDEYGNLVKASNPFAFWRFDQLQEGAVPNEMSAQYSLVLQSDEENPSVVFEQGRAEFREGPTPRFLTVKEGLPRWNQDSFSVEMWACPFRLHHGTLIDVMNEDWSGDLNTIEIALKTSLIHRPGAFRFFHRHPPGQSVLHGLNLFDHRTAVPGKWFHLAAVKTPDSLAFYINGQPVTTYDGAVGSDSNLYQLVIGQMDTTTTNRQFEGVIDEVALYSRALTIDAILQHYSLPVSQSPLAHQ